MGRAERITRAVKSKDSKLFCAPWRGETLAIWRESYALEHYVMDDGSNLVFSRPLPHLVCALTDNWSVSGRPVDWGILPILAKIGANDIWRRDIVRDLEIQDEKQQASNDRDIRNATEAFAAEYHSEFKKATSDINVSNLSKTENQRKRDKRGNY